MDEVKVRCRECGGDGEYVGSHRTRCSACKGTGWVPGEMPTPEQVEAAQREIAAEDEAYRQRSREEAESALVRENSRRAALPSEHPEHIHGMRCDGQDGMNSYCERLRRKLFGESA